MANVVAKGFEGPAVKRLPQGNHVGVRASYSADGRSMDLFAGVDAEFGEGATNAHSLLIAPGVKGDLIGRGRIWTLRWDAGGPCGSRAAIGNGLTKAAFLATLRRWNLIE